MKFRFALAAALAALSLSTPSVAQDLTDLSDEERAAFREEVRAYLLENPEVLVEAINVLESRQAEMAAMQDEALVQAYAEAIYESEHDWVGGNPDGDIVIVEFMDYRCGYCRRAFAEVEELLAADGNIRLILKEYPILGEQSTLASRFAISTRLALGDEAYKDVHDALMVMRADVTEESLRRLAESLDYDADLILAGMESDEVSEVIATNRELGRLMQITGTPSFIMSGQMLRGYLPQEQMAALAAQIRAEAE